MKTNLVGSKLGKYELNERLGRGGMAEVYKALQPGLQRFVAIKVLAGYFAESPQFVARFKREARSIAQLRHSHIVQVFDFDIEGDLYYMVMEYIQGGTLHQRIQKRGGLPIGDVIHIGTALADALDYAHQHGMIHRDIKPANVLFTDNSLSNPILTDFGIAHIIGGTSLTTSGFIGTPSYVSPEAARGEPVDERADIYSMGVMLYEMVSGRMPFYGETPYAILMKHVHEPLPSLRQVAPNLPHALEEVIYKALAKRADLRYQTAGELRLALQEAASSVMLPLPQRKAPARQRKSAPVDTPVMTPVFDVDTPVFRLDAEETTQEAPASFDHEPKRRKPVLLLLGLIGALLVGGYLVLGNSGVFGVAEPTSTQPSALIVEESATLTNTPTFTLTSSPTDEPTATITATPTETNTPAPTRVRPTRTLEPSDIPTRTNTPAATSTPLPPTPTRVPPTNPPAPPPTSASVSNPTDSGQQPAPSDGGQQPPPPPSNNVVDNTVDMVGDVVDTVGDTVGNAVGGLGLP